MRWIETFFPSKGTQRSHGKLPSLDIRGAKLPTAFVSSRPSSFGSGAKIPNASLIYGIGAGMMLACALYSLFTGAWVTSILLLLPAGALLGMALMYLRYSS